MPRHSLIFVTAFLVGAPFAHANTLRYKVGPLPFATVADGSSADLDPAADAIRILINRTVTVGGATYRVSGYVSAVASPPVTGKPALIVESLQIRNMAGNVIAGTLVVEHQFSANDNITYNDSLSGEFDNVVAPGWLNGGSLAYTSRIRSAVGGSWKTVASGFTGMQAGAAPIPFAFAGGPVNHKKVDRQEQSFTFYLDSPGDAILIDKTDGCEFSAAWLLPLAGWRMSRRRRAG